MGKEEFQAEHIQGMSGRIWWCLPILAQRLITLMVWKLETEEARLVEISALT